VCKFDLEKKKKNLGITVGLTVQFKAAVLLVARETKNKAKKVALLILHGVVSAILENTSVVIPLAGLST
jgi:hypothetical protein